jgi:2-oxo-4-hydroxy-4-carboxy-5-ureidoimidazoline decarboxylase
MNAPQPLLSLDSINDMSRAAFVAAFGQTFEHSPWVAEAAWEKRPFASIDELHAAMLAVVVAAGRHRQLALLRAHPDLAGKEAAAGTLTDASTAEQASAGLNALSRAEVEEIARLNGAYKARHGFPFIVCVRHYTKRGIFFEFRRRFARDSETELQENLVQIGAITRIRLELMTGE